MPKPEQETPEQTRQRGIAAIIFLQDMMGIKETPESAAKGWDGLSSGFKQQTLDAYDAFKSIKKTT